MLKASASFNVESQSEAFGNNQSLSVEGSSVEFWEDLLDVAGISETS